MRPLKADLTRPTIQLWKEDFLAGTGRALTELIVNPDDYELLEGDDLKLLASEGITVTLYDARIHRAEEKTPMVKRLSGEAPER